jgi:hypothetical protein
MNAEDLTKLWADHYGSELRGHNLRVLFPHRWFRIHSLPDSKRYAESIEERATILHRHNELLRALLAQEREVILITTSCTDAHNPAPKQDLNVEHAAAWYWATIPRDPYDPESSLWHLYVRSLAWRHGALNEMLHLVANWEIVNVMVVGITQRVLYLPYDGGADVIAKDTPEKDRLKAEFREWLSPLASGL